MRALAWLVVLVWSVALAEGCANEFGALPGDDAVEVKPLSISIEELHKRMVSDDAFEIPGSPVIRGSVTANDLSGNFYRSFVVEQDGFAVEVLEGSRSLASRYAEGAVVVISLEGLWMARSSGVLQVGVEASSTSSYSLDYLPHVWYVDRHIEVSGEVDLVAPLVVDLSMLSSTALFSQLCGRLVRIDGVELLVEGEAEGDAAAVVSTEAALWSGTNTFVDANGFEVDCYTSPYSDYAEREVATGRSSIVGILQSNYSGSGNPCVKMRYASDHIVE